MKFTGKFVGVKLDLPKYQRQLENYLVDLLHEGANAWLQAVAGSGGRVPLWSGMARASLLELSELVSGRVALTPLKGPSRISEGRSLGTATQEISESKVQITIKTMVPHYSLQESANVGVSKSAPWNSLLAGKLAYLEVVKDARLPGPELKPVNMRL